ncbi:DUF7683 domain-containing protein [Pseudomonas sp. GT1P32]
MRHVLEIFEKQTEELLQSVEIPANRSEELRQLMNWLKPEEGFDCYDLSPEQVETLQNWTGTNLDNRNHIVQLVCLE